MKFVFLVQFVSLVWSVLLGWFVLLLWFVFLETFETEMIGTKEWWIFWKCYKYNEIPNVQLKTKLNLGLTPTNMSLHSWLNKNILLAKESTEIYLL